MQVFFLHLESIVLPTAQVLAVAGYSPYAEGVFSYGYHYSALTETKKKNEGAGQCFPDE